MMRWVPVIAVVVLVTQGCGSSHSFWLASPPPAPTQPQATNNTCWDACQQRWNHGTAELAKCVSACPDVERREGSCPDAEQHRCVGDNRSAVMIILIGGVVATAAILIAVLI